MHQRTYQQSQVRYFFKLSPKHKQELYIFFSVEFSFLQKRKKYSRFLYFPLTLCAIFILFCVCACVSMIILMNCTTYLVKESSFCFYWTSVRILREKSVQAVSGVVHVQLYLHRSDTQQISLTVAEICCCALLLYHRVSAVTSSSISRKTKPNTKNRFRCDWANSRERNLIHSEWLESIKRQRTTPPHISGRGQSNLQHICCVDSVFFLLRPI